MNPMGVIALRKALSDMSPQQVIGEVRRSGCGQGGGGFPTADKWSYVNAAGSLKYVICNADEGDPGAFMDRTIIEADLIP